MNNTPKQIYESALNAVKSILAMQDVLEVHKKELLSDMIWKITERYGKFNAEYISQGAKKILNSNKSTGEKLQLLAHEHVYTRKKLIQRLIAKPKSYKMILKDATGCIVTREEHKKLSAISSKEGWERYKVARIGFKKHVRNETK